MSSYIVTRVSLVVVFFWPLACLAPQRGNPRSIAKGAFDAIKLIRFSVFDHRTHYVLVLIRLFNRLLSALGPQVSKSWPGNSARNSHIGLTIPHMRFTMPYYFLLCLTVLHILKIPYHYDALKPQYALQRSTCALHIRTIPYT